MTGESEVCSTTGLAVRPAAGQRSYRLAKPSYGVLNPPTRPLSSRADRSKWNRFDLPGQQTVYAASSLEGAYGELLGALKLPRTIAASDYLDDASDTDLYDLITQDWAQMGKQRPGTVDLRWIYAHRIYNVDLPIHGWFVEIEHARSITYLTQHIPVSLADIGLTEITVSETRSSDRHLTTALAELLVRVQIHASTAAHGIHYYSKHGTDWTCWAIWLHEHTFAALHTDTGSPVKPPATNPALARVLDIYNLTTS